MREKALKWWNGLDEKAKNEFCQDMFPKRNSVSLTGREVETIYTSWTPEIAMIALELRNAKIPKPE